MIPIMDKKQFTGSFLTNDAASTSSRKDVLAAAAIVIEEIRADGEAALKKYVEKFDGKVPENWEVQEPEKAAAAGQVNEKVYESLKLAAANIKKFHSKQLQNSRLMDMDGEIVSGQLYRPIERVGVYVPGGTASYPSTVLMNAIPAVLAGVKEVIMVTPVKDGEEISPELLAAAEIAGVHRIFKAGGIQAIAALAWNNADTKGG